jgi:hypothetical protein
VRRAVVDLDVDGEAAGWRRLVVRWPDGCAPTAGWWRTEPGWVLVVAGDPPLAVPEPVGGG